MWIAGRLDTGGHEADLLETYGRGRLVEEMCDRYIEHGRDSVEGVDSRIRPACHPTVHRNFRHSEPLSQLDLCQALILQYLSKPKSNHAFASPTSVGEAKLQILECITPPDC